MTDRPQNNTGPKAHGENCGFCNKHRNAVPLMVNSQVTNMTICAYCAMNIVTMTMQHMTQVSAAYKQVVTSKPEWFDRDEETGAITMIDPEKVLDKLVDDSNAH